MSGAEWTAMALLVLAIIGLTALSIAIATGGDWLLR
jgi:hypothetical protein